MTDEADTGLYHLELDLPPNHLEDGRPAGWDALNRAHALRAFEISNYWKRSNYFWLFQASALTLFGICFNGLDTLSYQVLLFPSGLGIITAQVGYMSALGSKFWQENWESHVDRLEHAHEGRLTQVILFKNGLTSSVSRVNERLFAILLIGWIVTFLSILLYPLWECFVQEHDILINVVSAGAIVLAVAFVGYGTRTDIRGSTGQDASASGLQKVWKAYRTAGKGPSDRGLTVRTVGPIRQ